MHIVLEFVSSQIQIYFKVTENEHAEWISLKNGQYVSLVNGQEKQNWYVLDNLIVDKSR